MNSTNNISAGDMFRIHDLEKENGEFMILCNYVCAYRYKFFREAVNKARSLVNRYGSVIIVKVMCDAGDL